ncbi:unnamed protein product [Polarella glacialis]|uniref:Uncharacterized protein n=1 Tax=Polarella glacialis TaxID=89957 RepID=A0A813HDI5_POLGL|nr:unnamed protein product [Polarella glacialis]
MEVTISMVSDLGCVNLTLTLDSLPLQVQMLDSTTTLLMACNKDAPCDVARGMKRAIRTLTNMKRKAFKADRDCECQKMCPVISGAIAADGCSSCASSDSFESADSMSAASMRTLSTPGEVTRGGGGDQEEDEEEEDEEEEEEQEQLQEEEEEQEEEQKRQRQQEHAFSLADASDIDRSIGGSPVRASKLPATPTGRRSLRTRATNLLWGFTKANQVQHFSNDVLPS